MAEQGSLKPEVVGSWPTQRTNFVLYVVAETKRKGDIGQSVIMARMMLDGYKIALPVGEDWRFDLIVLKDGKLVRVQCKYVTSDGQVINVPCKSSNNWSVKKYTPSEIDWIVVYDRTTDKCYYIPSSLLGECGRNDLRLRLTSTQNGQVKNVRYAKDFELW